MPALEDFKIESLPSTAFYIADFITPEEEELLLQKVSFVLKVALVKGVLCVNVARFPPFRSLDGSN
jgi:hypothetical protein